MPAESVIPTVTRPEARQFAVRVALFYGTVFGLIGTHLPFFPMWLRSVGIDAAWIGLITSVPAITRFTTLPFVTGLAERRQAIRGALIAAAVATAAGFMLVGTQHLPLLVLIAYVATCAAWTPIVPLTDAYALRGVVKYGLNYGRLRLSGSAAFVVGALACGALLDVISAQNLIWVIAGLAVLMAVASVPLQPLEKPVTGGRAMRSGALLFRDAGFLAIILASALIQGSHAAYYTFASIDWQSRGFGGLTIAALWSLGVLAEIVVFALSPRLTATPVQLVLMGAFSALLRWLVAAQEPQVIMLALVQMAHGLTYGLTQVGTMNLLVRQVPVDLTARGQGYFAAVGGVVMSVASVIAGASFARYGSGVYYLMAVMAALGGAVIWIARHRFAHPHSEGSGG